MSPSMSPALELVSAQGEQRIDSRLVAQGIGVQHDNLMQTIRKYQPGLEKYGRLLFQTGVKSGPQRGKLPQYVLLNKEQFGYLLMFVRVTDEVRSYRERVYEAFLAYERGREQRLDPRSVHRVTDALRPRALENLGNVPEGYFSVMGELFKHLYNLEAIIGQAIDEKAMIEISVGQLWSSYAREVLALPDRDRRTYPHRCPDGRIVQAYAYPLFYETAFSKWLWSDYFPRHFPSYQQYRAHRITPGRAKQRQIANQAQMNKRIKKEHVKRESHDA